MLRLDTENYDKRSGLVDAQPQTIQQVNQPLPQTVPHIRYKSNWTLFKEWINRHSAPLTVLFIAIMLAIPIGTHTFKKTFPEFQWNVKFVMYLSATIAAGAGLLNEYRPETLKARKFRDAKANADYGDERESWLGERAMEIMHADITRARQQHLQALSYGQYGLPHANPDYMQPLSFRQTEQPVNGQPNLIAAAVANPQSVAIPEAPQDTLANGMTIEAAYDYLHDKTRLNNPNILLFGDSGDTKTCMMHYALYRWIMHEPSLIPYVCDKKYFGEDNLNWRSNWLGLPVYRDWKPLKDAKFPVPSVYCQDPTIHKGNPQPNLNQWIEPVFQLVLHRMANKPADDPFYDPTSKSKGRRPVVIIIDDATTIIENMEGADAREVVKKLNEIATSGRNLNVHLWFIAHANTSQNTGLSQVALGALNPILGSSFTDNQSAMQWTKKAFIEEGIQAAAASRSGKARGFATAWSDNPYLPPANLPNGLLGLALPEMAPMICLWHKYAPDGFVLDDDLIWHKESFNICQFDINDRKNSPIGMPAVAPPPEEVNTEQSGNPNPDANHSCNPDPTTNGALLDVLPNNTDSNSNGKASSNGSSNSKPTENSLVGNPWDDPDKVAEDIQVLETLRIWYKQAKKDAKAGRCPHPQDKDIIDAYAQLIGKAPTDPYVLQTSGTIIHFMKLSDAKYQIDIYGDANDANDDLMN